MECHIDDHKNERLGSVCNQQALLGLEVIDAYQHKGIGTNLFY